MNPATINTTTFTLTGTGGASVSGQVSYDTATNIATFTPSGTLAPLLPPRLPPGRKIRSALRWWLISCGCSRPPLRVRPQ
jgi:hypothetical protein